MGEGYGVRKVVSCGLERILESCGFRVEDEEERETRMGSKVP
jgi:hypothetical protein